MNTIQWIWGNYTLAFIRILKDTWYLSERVVIIILSTAQLKDDNSAGPITPPSRYHLLPSHSIGMTPNSRWPDTSGGRTLPWFRSMCSNCKLSWLTLCIRLKISGPNPWSNSIQFRARHMPGSKPHARWRKSLLDPVDPTLSAFD